MFENLYTIRICASILVQVTIFRKLRIGRDGHLGQSEAYEISLLTRAKDNMQY